MLRWRAEEQGFRAWYAWLAVSMPNMSVLDGWMHEVAHFQELLVARDVCDERHRRDALRRLRSAHLYYPDAAALRQDVQVRCNFVTAGINTGGFEDVPLFTAEAGPVLLSDALEATGARRVLVVAGSSS